MFTPRYFFTNDFKQFYEYFLSQPHIKKSFKKGDYLWEPNKPFEKIHYIISGIAQNYVEHENGHRNILSFHGSGTVFPGYHEQDFKIEGALITVALCDMKVLEFTKAEFRNMFQHNPHLSAQVIDWFSRDVNLLIYETAHQEYNNSFIKLCNLLYLLLVSDAGKQNYINCITQNDIADILGISRVNLTRGLTRLRKENIIITKRKQIQVIDSSALIKYCSLETL